MNRGIDGWSVRMNAAMRLTTALLMLSSAVAVQTNAQEPTVLYPGYSTSLLVSGLSYPLGIVYRPASNDLLVCEGDVNNLFGANQVSRIDLATGQVSSFAPVAMPEHIAVDSMGNVYVTTYNDGGPVTVFDSAGQTRSEEHTSELQ